MCISTRNKKIIYTVLMVIVQLLLVCSSTIAAEKISTQSIETIRGACLDMITNILKPNKQVRVVASKALSKSKISEPDLKNMTHNLLLQFHGEVNTDFEDAPDYTNWVRETTATLIGLGLLSKEYKVEGYFRLADAYVFLNIDRWEMVEYLCVMESVKYYLELESNDFNREDTARATAEYKNKINEIEKKYSQFIVPESKKAGGIEMQSRLSVFYRYYHKMINVVNGRS